MSAVLAAHVSLTCDVILGGVPSVGVSDFSQRRLGDDWSRVSAAGTAGGWLRLVPAAGGLWHVWPECHRLTCATILMICCQLVAGFFSVHLPPDRASMPRKFAW